jgi:hypothetical protein
MPCVSGGMLKIRTMMLALAALGTAGAANASHDRTAQARLGQPVHLNGNVRVTPLRVLEDSRCPMEARCVWAGQVRLLVRITAGRNQTVRQITSNKPIVAGNGMLELVSVMPPKSTRHQIRPREYRFSFTYNRDNRR